MQPFITPVNKAGLPIAWQTLPESGAENCKNATPRTIAKLYWLLQELTITYSFAYSHSNEPSVIEGSITLTNSTLPHERILGPPLFEHSQNGPSAVLQAKLDLYNINHHHPFNNRYCFSLDFSIQEAKCGFYHLSLQNTATHLHVKDQKSFLFLNHNISAYLHTASPQALGIINNIQFLPHFYDFS